MEPSPSVFLRAIRREVISEDLLGAGAASGATAVIMQRAGEVLAQMVVRNEWMPKVLRLRRDNHLRLLDSLATRLQQRGITVPAAVAAAMGRAQACDGEPGEADLLTYDAISAGLSEGIRLLRAAENANGEDVAFTSGLCRAICGYEIGLKDEFLRLLAKMKSDSDENMPEDAGLPAPTAGQIADYLRRRFPADAGVVVSNVQRLVGDNSKDIFFFDVAGTRDFDGSWVMRREPAYNVTRATLANEYELLRHLKQAGIPVPRALVGEGDCAHFGGGLIITERLPGATRNAATLGPNAKPVLREMARISAHIHDVEIPRHLPQFTDATLTTRERTLNKVDAVYLRWLAERSEDAVVMESAYHWLHANVGCLDDTMVLTHGDYSLRNILLDGDKISAILDWELCRVSHPAEDVAYMRLFLGNAMPWEEYLAAYRAHAKHEVSDEALYYFDVWAGFWNLMIAASVYSGYHLDKHRNFVWASVACVEYPQALDRLARMVAAK